MLQLSNQIDHRPQFLLCLHSQWPSAVANHDQQGPGPTSRILQQLFPDRVLEWWQEKESKQPLVALTWTASLI